MATSFLGLVVGQKPTSLPQIDDDEVDFKFTNAALAGAKDNEKVQLYVHFAEEKYLVCVLNNQTIPQAHLELVFSSDSPFPISFSVQGSKSAKIHLSGFCSRNFDGIDYSDDEEELSDSEDDASERNLINEIMRAEMADTDSEEESEEEEGGVKLGIQEVESEEEEEEEVPPPKKTQPKKKGGKKGGLMDIDEEEAPAPKKAQPKKGGNNNNNNQKKKGGNQNKGGNNGPKTPQKGNQNKGNGPKTPQNKGKPQEPQSERKPPQKKAGQGKKRKGSPSESSLTANKKKKQN